MLIRRPVTQTGTRTSAPGGVVGGQRGSQVRWGATSGSGLCRGVPLSVLVRSSHRRAVIQPLVEWRRQVRTLRVSSRS